MNVTEICAACGDTRLNHVYHNESECQAFTTVKPLSPEERAERAWEADYPVTSSAAKREAQTGATRHHFTATQIKEAYEAGYLVMAWIFYTLCKLAAGWVAAHSECQKRAPVKPATHSSFDKDR